MDIGSVSTSSQTTSIGVTHQRSASTEGPKFHSNIDGRCAGSSKVSLAYKHLSSSGLKAGLGLLQTATSWKQDKEMRAGAANILSCMRSPLDQVAAPVTHGHTRQRHVGPAHRGVPVSPTEPKNCRRIVVLGAPRVGKTSILKRYLQGGFVEEYNPTSEDFLRKLFHIRGETYQIDILDASRERDFPAKRRLSILTGDIFLLVFSLDDRGSFEEVCALHMEILAAKSKLNKSSVAGQNAQPQVPLVICANKVDLLESERGISKAEVLRALGDGCAYFETSAKDSTNLDKVFETLAKRGGLPAETSPSQHRKVSLGSYQAMRTGRGPGRGTQTPERDDACGALYPLVRRPSFSTDLRHVIEPHAARKPGKREGTCEIQ